MDTEYWTKVGKGFLIALAGAALTYASTVFIPALQENPTPTMLIVLPILSALVNAAQKAILK